MCQDVLRAMAWPALHSCLPPLHTSSSRLPVCAMRCDAMRRRDAMVCLPQTDWGELGPAHSARAHRRPRADGVVSDLALGWVEGWAMLRNLSRDEGGEGGGAEGDGGGAGGGGNGGGERGGGGAGGWPTRFGLAPLSARHFCSGHLFWVQQRGAAADCVAVHTIA